MTSTISRETIEAAHARIAPHIRRTPVFDPAPGAFGVENRLSLKLEFLQHAGSFKSRGAFNTLLSTPASEAGVAAASGGNHGAAVAYAAKRLGVKARIFVPEISSPAKVAVIRSHGAEVVIGGARYADAQDACDRYVAESGRCACIPSRRRAPSRARAPSRSNGRPMPRPSTRCWSPSAAGGSSPASRNAGAPASRWWASSPRARGRSMRRLRPAGPWMWT
jgi:hypothetical protein